MGPFLSAHSHIRPDVMWTTAVPSSSPARERRTDLSLHLLSNSGNPNQARPVQASSTQGRSHPHRIHHYLSPSTATMLACATRSAAAAAASRFARLAEPAALYLSTKAESHDPTSSDCAASGRSAVAAPPPVKAAPASPAFSHLKGTTPISSGTLAWASIKFMERGTGLPILASFSFRVPQKMFGPSNIFTAHLN